MKIVTVKPYSALERKLHFNHIFNIFRPIWKNFNTESVYKIDLKWFWVWCKPAQGNSYSSDTANKATRTPVS